MFQSSENRIFPKGLTLAFGQKMEFFFSLKIRLGVRVNNVLDRKKKFFFDYKKKLIILSKITFFQRG